MSDTLITAVIGTGFAGSVVAERLASAGQRVLLIDQDRPYIDGNQWSSRNCRCV